MAKETITKLASLIDLERDHQKNAVQWALERLLGAGQCGVVLADEVGCGKTYEALALLALLWHHYRRTKKPIRRVLIVCKSSLLRKWHDELTANETQPDGTKHGIRPYLTDNRWQLFTKQFIDNLYTIENLRRAERLWQGIDADPLRGVREDRKIQVPNGLYLINQQLLYDSKRGRSKLLGYLYRTNWDLVIVDETHHYGKGNKCDSIFARRCKGLGRGGQPDFGIEGTLSYRHILLLTATPFELDPNEMLNLLRIVRAEEGDLEQLSNLLKQYQQGLNTFYGLRTLPPTNERRRKIVEHLHRLRVGQNGKDGLETLLRRYLVRNLKETTQREYALVNQDSSGWQKHLFDKFDDLKSLSSKLPLISFTGPDALFYLELRTLIQEVIEQRQADDNARSTFVAMDLQQGLSSYPQLLASSLLKHKSERTQYLRDLLTGWETSGRLHPKIQALVEIVSAIVKYEIERIKQKPETWFAKVVVFNKLVAGTAPHLRKQLEAALEPLVEELLPQLVKSSPFETDKVLRKAAQQIVREEVSRARDTFTRQCHARGEDTKLSTSVLQDAGFEIKRDTHAVDVLSPYFERRVSQALFLIDFLRGSAQPPDTNALRNFIQQNLIEPSLRLLDETIDKYLDTQPDPDAAKRLGKIALYETGIHHLSLLREKLRSPEIVARYDGKVGEDRESNRINFNERWNPLVLIVSRVGEEGIDLQRQARYILHYDLEWNPAKMEQREGRVDREGYGHEGEAIDVQFFLLKGTYEERIFHTVMQRDQWFQILMGQKRKSLGRLREEDEYPEGTADADLLRDTEKAEYTVGSLTPEEKKAVMVDLQPQN